MKDKQANEINLALSGVEEALAIEMLEAEQAEEYETMSQDAVEAESDNFSEIEYLTDAAEGAGYEFFGDSV